jgi:hypothetical protein
MEIVGGAEALRQGKKKKKKGDLLPDELTPDDVLPDQMEPTGASR